MALTLREKFHSYLEKYRVAVQHERDFGPQDPNTINYYKIANQAKLRLQQDLDDAEELVKKIEEPSSGR